ncbi:hypothetical protein NST23_03745 [Brevibacillus sp. FSL K6-0770]|uniref:hypothetical protein n=1 Tax=Brevibacillus TaxID=55080 RepID=UPI002475737E|nr:MULTISPECIES: hypothetical protein [Brevibacillus]MDH6352081.1 hypothetical protein [Brevibacillus sp. 1238]MED2254994.1 hypothetical protein [Brevibacillus parabrevis]
MTKTLFAMQRSSAIWPASYCQYYWEDIEPKFDKIVAAFEASFSAMADEIVEAFDYLYAKGIIDYHNIPKRLLNDAGDGVDLGQFDKRVDGNTRENEKTGWSIQFKKIGAINRMVEVHGNIEIVKGNARQH